MTSADGRAFAEGYTAGFRDGRSTLKNPKKPERAAGGEEEKPDTDKPLDLAAVKRMTSDEINARWDEVLGVLEGAHHG